MRYLHIPQMGGHLPFTTEATAHEIQNDSGLPQGPATGSMVG